MNETTQAQRTHLSDEAFKENLAAIIPQLRAFARNLCGDRDLADDLVQETMLKAWGARTRFEANTNFRAWTFMILRNHYFSMARRKRFTGAWDDVTAERILSVNASQDKIVELADLMRALQQISPDQREALILVGGGGLSYEEVAEITGVALGTVKSRVARGRMALEALWNSDVLNIKRHEFGDAASAVVDLLAYIEKLQTRRGSSAKCAAAIGYQVAA